MQEYYFESPLTNARSLCIGPITKSEALNADADGDFCDGLGFYLFTVSRDAMTESVQVLAKFVSETAAMDFAASLASARR